MDNQFIEIEQFAKLSGLSVSTIRRKIKSLSEIEKNAFIRRVPMVGQGGEKITISKAWLGKLNKHEYATNEDMNKHEQASKQATEGGNDNSSIIEILRGQIEYLQKQGEVKDNQILNLSEANKELIERLKEVNYTLANAQKQLSAPVDETQNDVPKWWQFWK